MALSIQPRGETDKGRRRPENEDSYLIKPMQGMPGAPAYLVVVADGMGGAAGGQVASSETVRAMDEATVAWNAEDPEGSLRRAATLANARVRGIVEERPELTGMATTLVAAYISDNKAWLANVGDSRAYLLHNGRMRRLTDDHSWVMEQVRAGVMTEAEAAGHPRRNIITRAIGTEPRVEVDLQGPITLEDGDTILLCSDGLYGVVSDAEMASYCTQYPPEAAATGLIALANAYGGPDNISVIVTQIGERSMPTMALQRPAKKGGVLLPALATLGVMAMVSIVGSIVFIASQSGGDGTQASRQEPPPEATGGRATPTPPLPTPTFAPRGIEAGKYPVNAQLTANGVLLHLLSLELENNGSVKLTFDVKLEGTPNSQSQQLCGKRFTVTQADSTPVQAKVETCPQSITNTTQLLVALGPAESLKLEGQARVTVDIAEWGVLTMTLVKSSAQPDPTPAVLTTIDCSFRGANGQKCFQIEVRDALIYPLAEQVARRLAVQGTPGVSAELRTSLTKAAPGTALNTVIAKQIYFHTKELYCASNATDVKAISKVELPVLVNSSLAEPWASGSPEATRWNDWEAATRMMPACR